jgi:twitching motility protein PilT
MLDNINHDEDFSFAVSGIGRFRANVFRQRGSFSAVIRVIPFGLPDPATLGIPEEVLRLSKLQKGLVLVTGPASSGKSTTLACIVDRMNHDRAGHIITLEDPIEYVHRHGTCIVTQREIPTDVATYAEALRSALRQSPDIILLGEMRDPETVATAMTAAETAQLLFSTLHTTSASGTVDRIVDSFPAEQQHQIRIQLSLVVQAIVSQQLVPTIDGSLVPAFEIMISNPAIRNLIRERKTHQIDSVIAASGKQGMRTMDQSLFDLVASGTVSKEMALQHSVHQEALEHRFKAEGL